MRTGEYNPSGSLVSLWLPDAASNTGAALAESTSTTSSWLLSDAFSNITAAVSTTGTTVSGTRPLNAFGTARAAASGALTTSAIGFAGQYLEAATGLYDMRARDYDPGSGRFTANDPVAVPVGMPYVGGYSYSFNNPMTRTDAGGTWSNDCGFWSWGCDSGEFAWNELIGLGGVMVGIIEAIANPVKAYESLVSSCEAGLAQYGASGPSFEGWLQCTDNLNPIAGIFRQVNTALTTTSIAESGQAIGSALTGATLIAAPFAKPLPLSPFVECDPAKPGVTAPGAGGGFPGKFNWADDTGAINPWARMGGKEALLPGEGAFPYIPPSGNHGLPLLLGKGQGYLDKSGNRWIWAPPGGQHGGPHWDVPLPGGGHRNIFPDGHERPQGTPR